jgi:CheY-like chemotaxis protein
MLEPAQLDLVFEADGAAALGRAQSIGPDLVLMDVMLSGGSDGVDLTGQIKAMPDLAAIPVLMMTGEARLDTLVRSMEAGAADFIVKPFTREALLAKVGKYLPAAA